ncbi:MAG: diguanylate cyclase [Verrucomicrobia bacterium]|nr:diguanylate cyclase [Verrucomicrobiota bacterium]
MRIVVAEDDSFSADVLPANLQAFGYEVVLAADGADAWHILQSDNPPRLALLDWVMPSMDGIEVCRKIRRSGGPYVYIILLTANTETADVVKGIDAGADDYIKKPYEPEELLTGLLNRSAILDALDAEFQAARREGASLSVAVADLDAFKKINDTHGHLAGDAVLRETAERMRFCVRSQDSIGRYGGEEFVIIFRKCGLPEAAGTAERLREFVSAEPILTGSTEIAQTLSLGVADVQDFEDYEALLRAADDALLRAKRGGRNRVELARGVAEDSIAPSGPQPIHGVWERPTPNSGRESGP